MWLFKKETEATMDMKKPMLGWTSKVDTYYIFGIAIYRRVYNSKESEKYLPFEEAKALYPDGILSGN